MQDRVPSTALFTLYALWMLGLVHETPQGCLLLTVLFTYALCLCEDMKAWILFQSLWRARVALLTPRVWIKSSQVHNLLQPGALLKLQPASPETSQAIRLLKKRVLGDQTLFHNSSL